MKAVILAAFLVSGCAASAVDTARETLRVAAVAGAEADQRLALRVDDMRDKALRQSKTFSEYQGRMAHLAAAVDAVAVFRQALLAAEHALDAWDVAGEPNDFLAALGCLAAAVRDVAWTFMEAGISAPFSLSKAEAALKSAPGCKEAR